MNDQGLSWVSKLLKVMKINELRPKQNGHNFADYIFKYIFLNELLQYWNMILLKYICKGLIDRIISIGSVITWGPFY